MINPNDVQNLSMKDKRLLYIDLTSKLNFLRKVNIVNMVSYFIFLGFCGWYGTIGLIYGVNVVSLFYNCFIVLGLSIASFFLCSYYKEKFFIISILLQICTMIILMDKHVIQLAILPSVIILRCVTLIKYVPVFRELEQQESFPHFTEFSDYSPPTAHNVPTFDESEYLSSSTNNPNQDAKLE